MSKVAIVEGSAGQSAPVDRERAFRAIMRRPVAAVSVVLLVLITLVCAFAPLLAPYGPLEQDLLAALQGPSRAHWLGTDTLGRDVLSRLMYGGRPALVGALIAVIFYVWIGVAMGLVSGYSDGALDRLVSAVIDILMSLPAIVVMLAVLAMFDNSLYAAMLTLGVFASGGLARVVRATTKATREELYVAAARVSGLGTPRILARHILPRLTGPIIVQVSLFFGIALVVQSGLGFLNLGVTPPAPTWGAMVGEASQVISQAPWLLVPSGTVIGVTVLLFGLIGDAARDAKADSTSRSGGARRRHPYTQRGEAAANGALVQVAGLTVTFHGRVADTEVVRDIAFDVHKGELLGIVGESGSGKTVTALSLLGLLPANAGVTVSALRVGEHDLSDADQRAFRKIRGTQLALISQEPMVALDPAFTVRSQLREVIRSQGCTPASEINNRVIELLRSVRLSDPEAVAARYPHQLSGGMAQRVVIALALAGDPAVLIADEPTTALDVTVQAEILELLRQLREQTGMAIVLVTHDLGVVADFCERVVVMQHGKIVEQQTVSGLFARPQHAYTQSLIAATPSLVDLPAARHLQRDDPNDVGHASAGSR